MIEIKEPVSAPRRKFLGGLLAIIGGAVALPRLSQATDNMTSKKDAAEHNLRHEGYQESDHVKTYYEKARF